MKSLFIYIFSLFFCCTLKAQSDTTTLNVEELMRIVKQYHPVVKLAAINIEKANADRTIARGAFDPIINTYIANKNFDNKNYYENYSPNITIPTWFGIEVSAGIESLTGQRLDPTETVGQSSYIGLSIPLLKNLVMDKRRAYLLQSRQFQVMSQTEKNAVVNNILMDASAQFWQWVNAYQSYQIISAAEELSRKRFLLVQQTYLLGDRPAMDTIEAMTQYQSFQFQKTEQWQNFINEGLQLSAFLWKENNTPYELPKTVIPQAGWDNEELIKSYQLDENELLIIAAKEHPELQLYTQKLNILQIEKRLKIQELLPKLDVSAFHLSKGFNPFRTQGSFFNDNYQYGIKFSMPLLFSVGRGEFKKTKLKIEETKINQEQKSLSIALKIKNYYNDFQIYKSQVALQRTILENLKQLLKAEETLFYNGESSLFLINSRESKVLESERKLVELKTKYYKSIYSLQGSAGLLR